MNERKRARAKDLLPDWPGEFRDRYIHAGERTLRLTVRLEDDTISDAPWENSDIHGPVSDWRDAESKAPGERVLVKDRGSARFYDIQEANAIAKRDGWGCAQKGHKHRTKGEERACAVEQDFRFLQDWCEDRWTYVGLIVTLYDATDSEDREEDEELAEEAVWGYEYSSSVDYLDTEYLNSEARSWAHSMLREYRRKQNAGAVA